MSAVPVNKPNLFNEANEDLYNPCEDQIIDPFYTEIEYPEWNDAELNAEVWDENKTKPVTSDSSLFQDPNLCELPPKIQNLVASWMRPVEVYPDANLTVYDPSNENFTLKVSNPFAKCDIFETFIESLTTLQVLALKFCFPVELETPAFASNTQGEQWRPWHHVYALCKAGKGTVHKPMYCPYGKYVLRLFYMGAWRRFVVDDLIPCDKKGHCLFPVTQVPGELWPIILMKGLLKIFSIPPNVKELPFLSIFTGWTGRRIMALNKSYEQIWRRLVLLVPKYELSEEGEKDTALRVVSKIGSSKKDLVKEPDNEKGDGCCFLLGNLKFPEKGRNEATVVVRMNRDTPLVKANKRESTKPWKKIRWVYWALKKGLWTDESRLPPYRRIYCINFREELCKRLLPDPKLESVLFDLPADGEENIPTADEKSHETEDWYDYNAFYDCLFSLTVYLKPGCFTSNAKVSSLQVTSPKRTESRTGSKTASKPLPPVDTFFYSPLRSQNCAEPPLLFCESTKGIFLSITLWCFPFKFKNHVSHKDELEFLKFSFGSLYVERFDWRNPELGEIIGALQTLGSSSMWLYLKPGRHVLKLWLDTEGPYVISVHSNVEVVIHSGPKIRFFLKNEAERILQYINNVSNAFITLTQKFGKPDLPASLREFYSIIKPGNDSAPGYFKKIDEFIEIFLNCILLCLKSVTTSADELKMMMGALQSLFFDPEIRCELPRSSTVSAYGGVSKKPPQKSDLAIQEGTNSEILTFPRSSDDIEKVTLIQKIFRGYRVRLLWKRQTPSRKEFKPYTERLKKICDAIFIPSKREAEVGKLLRKILMINPNLLTTFKFHYDFQNTIDVQEYTGKMANVEPFAWVPIARFIIACNSDSPIPCAFYLSCNLDQYVIQGVDNDTNEEIFKLVNCISPRYYYCNDKGYTIFVHGWNKAKPKTVNWRLQIVKMKYFDMLQLYNTMMSPCGPTSLPPIEVLEIKNFYVPNSKERVCRCLIKIHKRTLLTLKLSSSYPEANIELTISLDKGFSLSESVSGTSDEVVIKMVSTRGAVLLSAVFLEHFENPYRGESDADYTLYTLEAYVLNNSWPLTKHEWGVIEPIRVNGETWRDNSGGLQSKRGMNESRRKFSRISRRASFEIRPIESPYWILQTVIESQGPDNPVPQMVIEEDKSFAEYVRNMKYQWEEKDPGRRSRGNDLRMKFLYTIWLETRNVLGEGEGDLEMGKPEDDDSHSEFSLLIRRMSSFSYLLEDPEPKRYIKSPRVLPQMPTEELLLRYKKQSVAHTVATVTESSIDQRSHNSTDMNRSGDETATDETEEQTADFLTQCVHYREVMTNYINEERKLSNRLMEEAYEDRVKAIRRLSRMEG